MSPRLTIDADTSPLSLAVLDALAGGFEIASVTLCSPAGGAPEAQAARGPLERLQARGIAVLIAQDARLARLLKADGVHLGHGAGTADPTEGRAILDGYREAREILGQRFIIGAEPGSSRHTAMELGEAGCDYVAFGPEVGGDEVAGLFDRAAFCGWWAEVFEVPVVARDVADPEEVAVLSASGCDFVGYRIRAGIAAAEQVAAVRALMRAAELAASGGFPITNRG